MSPDAARRGRLWCAARPAILGAACLTALFLATYTTLTRTSGGWTVVLAQQQPCSARPPAPPGPPARLLWELSPLLAQEVDRKMDPFKGAGISRSDLQGAVRAQAAKGGNGPALCVLA